MSLTKPTVVLPSVDVVGVLSDSHGQADTTGRAVAALLQAGAQLLLHLGDIGSDAVIDELAGHPARIVLGNCDLDERALSRYAELVGVTVDHPLGDITLGGRRLAYTHGHLPAIMKAALASRPAYLLHGHSHLVRDERIGGVRIINPGALHRAARYTVAVLEPQLDRLRFIDIGRTQ
jgi:putative phosphoesterase